MGCGSSSPGSTTQAQQTTTTPPQSVLNAYQGLINQATQVAQQPLRQYQGPVIAGFNPTQQTAFSEVNQAQGAALPYLNAAQTYLGAGATPVQNSVQQFNPQTLSQYENPYTQQVTRATENLLNNQNAQQFNQANAAAASTGAFGGDRQAVLEAQMAQQQQLAEDPTLANIQSQGFTGAEQELNQQQNLQLQGASASDWLAQNAAGLESGLGTTAQNSLLSGANAELGAGNQQQALQQSELNVPLAEFQQQQAFPYQTTNYLAGLIEGTAPGMGGTATTTYPGANWITQLGGAALTGIGALQNSGIFGNGSTSSTPSIYSPGLGAASTSASVLNNIGASAGYMKRGGAIRVQHGPHSVLALPHRGAGFPLHRDSGGLVPVSGGFPSLSGDDTAEINQTMGLLDASPVSAPPNDGHALSVPQPSTGGGNSAANGSSGNSASSFAGTVAQLAPIALALLARGGEVTHFPRAFADGGGDGYGADSDPAPALGQDPGDLRDRDLSSQGQAPQMPSSGAASLAFPRMIQGPAAAPATAQANSWLNNPLTQIGIGMMTSRSPSLLGGIGAGLQQASRNAHQQEQFALEKQKASAPHVDTSGNTMKLVYPDGSIFDTGLGTGWPRGRSQT